MTNQTSQLHRYRPTRSGKCDVCIRSRRDGLHLRECRCGEPEMLGFEGSGDFGWFTSDEGTFCNRCGRKQR